MNIFVLDEDPIVAASYYCNEHMKIILEIAQMLCTTSWSFSVSAPYKKTHVNHVVSKWVRETIDNYNWTVIHGLAIAKQYTLRYNKIHKSQAIIEWCRDNGGKPINTGLTPFAQAMPDIYRNKNAVIAYRNFYIHEKSKFATWEPRTLKPDWVKTDK